MIDVIAAVLIVAGLWYWLTATTFERYLAVMALKRARDEGRLNTTSKVFGYPVALRALLTDAFYNCTFGMLPFLFLGNPLRALPREWLFTSRMERHIREGGLRGRLARRFCRRMMDPFDPDGRHCD